MPQRSLAEPFHPPPFISKRVDRHNLSMHLCLYPINRSTNLRRRGRNNDFFLNNSHCSFWPAEERIKWIANKLRVPTTRVQHHHQQQQLEHLVEIKSDEKEAIIIKHLRAVNTRSPGARTENVFWLRLLPLDRLSASSCCWWSWPDVPFWLTGWPVVQLNPKLY